MYLFLHIPPIYPWYASGNFTFQNVSISTWMVQSDVERNCLYIPKCIYFYAGTSWFSQPVFQLYIPKCIYFYRYHNYSWHPYLTLHSKMYLFLPASPAFQHTIRRLYIPKCIYFYTASAIMMRNKNTLYIPKCIYFYAGAYPGKREVW